MINKVYIIILNYNNWYDTIECLESVLKSSYKNFQVIVVDNASPDNSLDYLVAWADGRLNVWVNPTNPLRNLSFPPDPKPIPYIIYSKDEAESGGNLEKEERLGNPIVFIKSDRNGGFSYGNNIAIRYALAKDDFDAIVLLNNDTVVHRECLSRLVDTKRHHGANAIYGGRIFYYYEPAKIWYDGGKLEEWLIRAVHLNFGKSLEELCEHRRIIEVSFLTFCFVMIPKEVLLSVGLLNERYFMYTEDMEYSLKTTRAGYKIYVNREVVLWHKVGSSSGGEITPFSVYWGMRSRVMFIKQNLSITKKILAFTFIILTRFIRIPQYIFSGKLELARATLKGLFDGVSN